jgi:hypothetical protein
VTSPRREKRRLVAVTPNPVLRLSLIPLSDSGRIRLAHLLSQAVLTCGLPTFCSRPELTSKGVRRLKGLKPGSRLNMIALSLRVTPIRYRFINLNQGEVLCHLRVRLNGRVLN